MPQEVDCIAGMSKCFFNPIYYKVDQCLWTQRRLDMQSDKLKYIKENVGIEIFYMQELTNFRPRNWKQWTCGGLCPFHKDKRQGSFWINISSGAYKCFSCGAKGGDVIAFVCQKYSLRFKQALDRLQNEYC
jgi:hypothetical protein